MGHLLHVILLHSMQSGVAEDSLKLEEIEERLSGHESLKKLKFHFPVVS